MLHIEPKRQSAVRLSNRQYGQLRAMLNSPNATLTVDEVAGFNQITLGANKRRGFITETRRKDGVSLTYAGRQVLQAFDRADIMRQVASMNFSTFLHLKAPVVPRDLPQKKRTRTVRQFQSARRAKAA